MTWRPVGLIYLALASLVLYFVLFERTSEPPATATSPGAAERSLLGIDQDAVRAVVFRRDGLEVRAARDGGRWRVVGPLETSVQPDLIAAAVATLTAGQESEVMGEPTGETLDEFGLAAPTSEIDVTLSDEHDAFAWLSRSAARRRYHWPRERESLDHIAVLFTGGHAGAAEDALRIED